MTANMTVDAQFDKTARACIGNRDVSGPQAQLTIACTDPLGYVHVQGPEGSSVSEAQGPSGWSAMPSGGGVTFTTSAPTSAGTAEPFMVIWTTALGSANAVSATAGLDQSSAVSVSFP